MLSEEDKDWIHEELASLRDKINVLTRELKWLAILMLLLVLGVVIFNILPYVSAFLENSGWI